MPLSSFFESDPKCHKIFMVGGDFPKLILIFDLFRTIMKKVECLVLETSQGDSRGLSQIDLGP